MSPRNKWLLPSTARVDDSAHANETFPLDKKLFQYSPKGDALDVRDLVRSVAEWGSPGSGKTRTAYFNIAECAWDGSVNHCGVIFCVKPDAAEQAIKAIKRAGRMHSLRHVKHGGRERFAAMDWAMAFARKHEGGIPVRAATGVIDTMLEIYYRGRMEVKLDAFFGAASENMIHQNIKTLVRKTGGCKMDDLMACCEEMPPDSAAFNKPEKYPVVKHLTELHEKGIWDKELEALLRFYRHHSSLSPETRTSIEISATTRLKPLLEEPIASVFFNGESTITPEMIDEQNLLVVVDYPIANHGPAARAIGATFLEACQTYGMSRKDDPSVRPFGLWLDEGFSLALESTIDAIEKGRSSKLYSCWTGQTKASVIKGFGGDKNKADALCGAIGTHCFFRQLDPETRGWAEAIAGKRLKWRVGFSHVVEDAGQISYSQQEAPALPEENMLGTKTSAEEPYAESYIIDGRRWRWNGEHHILMRWYVPGTKWRWWWDFVLRCPAARQWSKFPAWYRWAWNGYEKIRRQYRRYAEVFNGNR